MGVGSVHSNRPDDKLTYASMAGYEDLPSRGGYINPFIGFCERPYPWNDVISSEKLLQQRLGYIISKINSEPLIPPDDDCALDDLFNDKRNLRGLEYIAFLANREEQLYIVGNNTTVNGLSVAGKAKYKQLIYNKFALNYPELSKLAQDVMYESGITNY